jgi:hypothetical protein
MPETSGRPLLPQTAQMQSFTFAPPTLAPRENQRSELRARPQSAEVEDLTDIAKQTMSLSTSTTGTNASKVRITDSRRVALLT